MLAATAMLPMAIASADPPTGGPPGQDECDHGNSDNDECRPDPGPGQDCEEHGNSGGVNEDHCGEETTSTSTTVVTPPTETETTVTSTTTSSPPDETDSTTTSVTDPPATTTTSATTDPPTTSVPPTLTSTPPSDGTTTRSVEGPEGKIDKDGPKKLAFTGLEDIVPIAAVALTLLGSGTGLMWLGRKKEDEYGA
jgi:hypothetical protein